MLANGSEALALHGGLERGVALPTELDLEPRAGPQRGVEALNNRS